MEKIMRQFAIPDKLNLASNLLFKYGELSFITLKIFRTAIELLASSSLEQYFIRPFKTLKKIEDFTTFLKGFSSLKALFNPKRDILFIVKTVSGLVLLGLNSIKMFEKISFMKIKLSNSPLYRKFFLASISSFGVSIILLSYQKKKQLQEEEKRILEKIDFWKNLNSFPKWQKYSQDKISNCQQKMNRLNADSREYKELENQREKWRTFRTRISTLSEKEFAENINKIFKEKIEKLDSKKEKLAVEEKLRRFSIYRGGISLSLAIFNKMYFTAFFQLITNSIDIIFSYYNYSYNLEKKKKDDKINEHNLEIERVINEI